MLKAQAYEANMYWRCPKCGYEHNTMWFYEGNSSYKFTCGCCGEDVLVSPPKSDAAEAVEQPTTGDQKPAAHICSMADVCFEADNSLVCYKSKKCKW